MENNSDITNGNNSAELTGVILAAGRGVRAYPATKYIPKALLEVDGKPLILRNIEIMRDKLNIHRIMIVIGHCGNQLIDYFKELDFGVKFEFIKQEEHKGIGHALLMVEDYIETDRFVVMLADELYIDSNHSDMLEMIRKETDAVLLFKKETDRNKISNNYTGDISNGRINSLIEKPENPTTGLMGVGTYLLSKKVFDYIRSTPPSSLRNEIEITDVLSSMAKNETVLAYILEGNYLNVNNIDDLNHANYLLRETGFDNYKVSIVIPAYNEEETIVGVIEEFIEHEAVDEILVVDNNSKDRTNELAQKAGARVVVETKQGYGNAIKRGLDDANGDIIILTEADGSFSSKDIPKFLEYLKDSDMVIGTRTTRQMIEQGANMHFLVRWINVIYGKIVEALWWNQEPRFTDVGCTYRAIWKSSYKKIRPYLKAPGPEFAPEMMIAILICKRRIIEIPISYRKRLGGESKHSGEFKSQAKTALKMMRVIIKNRLFSGRFTDLKN